MLKKWYEIVIFTLLALLIATKANAYLIMTDEALFRAKDAALIQTGIQSKIDMLSAYAEGKARTYIQKVGLEKPTAVAMTVYMIYKTRQIHWHTHGYNITISPDVINENYSLGVSWNFK